MKTLQTLRCMLVTTALLLTLPRANLPVLSAAALDTQAARLAALVTIHRDEYGVPHVFGPTDASVVFGYAYAQAEDGFSQIEDNYIRALGRSSEVYGERMLPADSLNRALEIATLSRLEYERADPRTRQICDAMAEGLNYYLAANPHVRPALLTRFEPWYILAFTRYALYQLFMLGNSGLTPAEYRRVVGEETEAETARLPFGSNAWAVGPSKTVTGRSMLFINPHLSFSGTLRWHEGHLRSREGWEMSGATFYGLPFPIIGHNGQLGWTHTVNTPDVSDLYAEKLDRAGSVLLYRYGGGTRPVAEWKETFKIKNGESSDTKVIKLTKTHHGPIVTVRDGRPLALRLARIAEGGYLDQWYAMGKARTFAEFKAAMARGAIPMFNTAYADRAGNIYYLYNGAVPRRSTRFNWSAPVDGSDPATEWQGYHSLAELPQLTNPKSGYVQNCNSTPFLTTESENPNKADYPAYMVMESDNARARISRTILGRAGRFTFDDWARLSHDTRVGDATAKLAPLMTDWERLKESDVERAAKLEELIAELKSWNGVSQIESRAMTLFTLWQERLSLLPGANNAEPWLAIRVLEDVRAELERSHGTWRVTWGELNRLQRPHSGVEFSDSRPSLPVAGGPGDIIFSFIARPAPGQIRRYGIAGNTFVSVVEFSARTQARSVLVFGQSNDPLSPHYFDQAPLYARGDFKTAWFFPQDVKKHTVRSYRPGQGSQSTVSPSP